jgi:hypothetical protein
MKIILKGRKNILAFESICLGEGKDINLCDDSIAESICVIRDKSGNRSRGEYGAAIKERGG